LKGGEKETHKQRGWGKWGDLGLKRGKKFVSPTGSFVSAVRKFRRSKDAASAGGKGGGGGGVAW